MGFVRGIFAGMAMMFVLLFVLITDVKGNHFELYLLIMVAMLVVLKTTEPFDN